MSEFSYSTGDIESESNTSDNEVRVEVRDTIKFLALRARILRTCRDSKRVQRAAFEIENQSRPEMLFYEAQERESEHTLPMVRDTCT